MALVTLGKVKEYVGETTTDNDDFINDQIAIISEAVEGYCSRKFEQATYTQTFEAQAYQDVDKYKIHTFHFPVISIASVKEIDGTSEETITTYLLEKDKGLIRRTDDSNYRTQWFGVYGHNSKVEVVYDAGYATVPLIIQDTVCALVAERYNKKIAGVNIDFGANTQRVSIPGVMSIDFDYTLQANERTVRFGMILGNYVNNLDHFRSERVITGEIRENYVS